MKRRGKAKPPKKAARKGAPPPAKRREKAPPRVAKEKRERATAGNLHGQAALAHATPPEALTQVPALTPALSQREREQQPLGGASGPLYTRIRSVLIEARAQVWRAVNVAMVAAYWEIGRVIVEEEQRGAERAGYGQELLKDLSRRLTADFGKGFDRSNLQFMRAFYLLFPNCDALRRELSWTHYRILLKVEKPDARSFYEQEAVAARWSTRELERQVASLLFERLALSRDKAGVLKLANEGHEIAEPGDLVKDPYVLEFTGLAPTAQLRE